MLPNPKRNRLSTALHHTDTETALSPPRDRDRFFARMTLPNESLFGPAPSGRTHDSRVNRWLARLSECGMSMKPPLPRLTPWPTLPGTRLMPLVADGLFRLVTSRSVVLPSRYQLTGSPA